MAAPIIQYTAAIRAADFCMIISSTAGRDPAPKWLLDPIEWDLRFVRFEEIPVLAVYEYARSCPWLRPIWEKWLDYETVIPGRESSASKTGSIREAILTAFSRPNPPWALNLQLPDSLTKTLKDCNVDTLAWRTPSFPMPWTRLPDREKTAALGLLPEYLPAFREAPEPTWSVDPKYLVTVDFNRDFAEIRIAMERWLCRVKDAYDLNCRNRVSLQRTSGRNLGRAGAIRKEALSWLVSYRYHHAKIEYCDGANEIDAWVEKKPDPEGTQFAKPITKRMTKNLWEKWNERAEDLMVAMFQPDENLDSNRKTVFPSLRAPTRKALNQLHLMGFCTQQEPGSAS